MIPRTLDGRVNWHRIVAWIFVAVLYTVAAILISGGIIGGCWPWR